MKKILLLISLTCIVFFAFGQKKRSEIDRSQIKQTCTGFLKWYKINNEGLATPPLVVGFNPDSVKKDSILKINMSAVETYLTKFGKSGYVSDVFLNQLRLIYKRVADTLISHPLKDYFGPVPYLESDVIFGFGQEDVFNDIHKGKFEAIYVVYDKALVKLRLSYTIELIYSLTKIDNKWLIDSIGFNGDNKYNIGSQ